jgi:hypothetical protein
MVPFPGIAMVVTRSVKGGVPTQSVGTRVYGAAAFFALPLFNLKDYSLTT